MKIRFTAIVFGEVETGPSFPVLPVAALVAALALLYWLGKHLLAVAVIAGAAIAVITGIGVLAWLVRPRSDRDAELLAERTAGLNAEVAETAARTAPKAVENHYHLHLPPGTDARGVNWAALPVRDAVIEKEK